MVPEIPFSQLYRLAQQYDTYHPTPVNVEDSPIIRRTERARNAAIREIRQKYAQGRFRVVKTEFMLWWQSDRLMEKKIEEYIKTEETVTNQIEEIVSQSK
jgi:hypothetical protein